MLRAILAIFFVGILDTVAFLLLADTGGIIYGDFVLTGPQLATIVVVAISVYALIEYRRRG